MRNVIIIFVVLIFLSCNDSPVELKTQHYPLKVEKVITTGIQKPQRIEFIDSLHSLIISDANELTWLAKERFNSRIIFSCYSSYTLRGIASIMDLTLDPHYTGNGLVYVSYRYPFSMPGDNFIKRRIRISRGKIIDNALKEEEILFEIPETGNYNAKSRILITRDDHLYFTSGDMFRMEDAQNLSSFAGKVFRISLHGTIPATNPYYGRKDSLDGVYSFGVRNPEALGVNPVSGEVYEVEQGIAGGDEINTLKPGANYGWPLISHDSIFTRSKYSVGVEQPLSYYTPSIGISAITCVHSAEFPIWDGNLLIGSAKSNELRRLVLKNNRVVADEILLKGYGRIRDVKIGPDGCIYVITNFPDALLRISHL